MLVSDVMLDHTTLNNTTDGLRYLTCLPALPYILVGLFQLPFVKYNFPFFGHLSFPVDLLNQPHDLYSAVCCRVYSHKQLCDSYAH